MKQIMLNLFWALAVCSTLNLQVSTICAQATVVTYQGRVTSNGTNFTGAGQFKFVLVTSTNNNNTATATANVSGGFVTTYTVTFAGNGYLAAPAVTISGARTLSQSSATRSDGLSRTRTSAGSGAPPACNASAANSVQYNRV